MHNETPYYQLAKEYALSTNRSIFLTGKAGTGKTTFLRKLKAETKKQVAIVAPTGVAAINAGGTTIHSFFQLPFTPFLPSPEGRKGLIDKIKMAGHKRKVIQELELLVIDEISMVRADVLDAIDTLLRHVRYRRNEPFGGVQMLFIGDMFQLSPVAGDEEWRILSRYYTSPYFFHSLIIQEQQPLYIELNKIFRQTNADFIEVLNQVRNNCLTPQGLSLLQSRYNPQFVAPKEDTYITLTTHNYKADRINAEELSKVTGKTHKFKASITGEFPDKIYPTDFELEMKIGAKVMFIKNDTENPRRFYNGKIGMIEKMEKDSIFIQCPEDDELIELERMVWSNMRYKTNDTTKQIEENTIGQFTQFPLRLAWAITIHKSQGLTFNKAIIDAGNAFASGQVYVALSRCKTLEGMVLLSKINPSSIENNKQIVEHQKNKISIEELEGQLNESQNQFRNYSLSQLFDFTVGVGHAARLVREVAASAKSFNSETAPFLADIHQQSQAIQDVANKFKNQLVKIFEAEEINEDYLAERLDAAIVFFTDKIANLMDTMKESPAISDSREKAREYSDQLKSNFGFFAQKLHIFNHLKHPFSVESYFEIKNTFLLPYFSVNAYAKNDTTKRVASKNPDLYNELSKVRNNICDQGNLPIYIVAGSTTLLEMADYLPLTKKDLLNITGFGPVKAEKYGDLFLDVINDFCSKNKLESLMDIKLKAKEKKKSDEKKEPKKKGATHLHTYDLYKAGKSVQEIAKIRGLETSTIASHLTRFIESAELSIDAFLSEEKRRKGVDLLNSSGEVGSVYQTLNSLFDKAEVTFLMWWIRSQKAKETKV